MVFCPFQRWGSRGSLILRGSLSKVTEHVSDRTRTSTQACWFVSCHISLRTAAFSLGCMRTPASCLHSRAVHTPRRTSCLRHPTRSPCHSQTWISTHLGRLRHLLPLTVPGYTHGSTPTALCLPAFHSFSHCINSEFPLWAKHLPNSHPNPLLPQAPSSQ